MANKKRVKRRINYKGLLLILLILYLIGTLFYNFLTMPIKNIYIKGTSLLTDNEIIEIASIKNYPSILKINNNKIIKKIKELELVKDVSIEKKLSGKLVINITEEIPLFYNRNNEKVILSSGKEVENNKRYTGIPTLINYTPNETLERFNEAFSKIDLDIIKMINEIEYSPDIVEDITVDADRFILRMNDGNIVHINIINIERLNNYKKIYTALTQKGTLYLDSYDEGNVYGLFTPFSEESSKGDSSNDGGEN